MISTKKIDLSHLRNVSIISSISQLETRAITYLIIKVKQTDVTRFYVRQI
uniref:Uncharacterized protein n=1 Tax=Rhizophora mucronata TaxID=61149 RepID=A0A2P2QAN5_RHIMU